MSSIGHLVAAYAVVGLGLGLYFAALRRRLARLQRLVREERV